MTTPPRTSRGVHLPGRGIDRVPDVRGRSEARRLQAIEEDIDLLQAELHPVTVLVAVGKNILAQQSSAGSIYYGMLTLPKSARVLDVYAWVPEPIASSGTPRGGFVALTSLNFSVGTIADPDYYLTAKNAYGLVPTWSVAADKGVGLSSDARISSVASFTDDTEVRLEIVPNASGDLTLITGGKINVVFTYIPIEGGSEL